MYAKEVQYVWMVIALFGIVCILVLLRTLHKIMDNQRDILQALYVQDGSLTKIADHTRNIDIDMYTICQKNGLRASRRNEDG